MPNKKLYNESVERLIRDWAEFASIYIDDDLDVDNMKKWKLITKLIHYHDEIKDVIHMDEEKYASANSPANPVNAHMAAPVMATPAAAPTRPVTA